MFVPCIIPETQIAIVLIASELIIGAKSEIGMMEVWG